MKVVHLSTSDFWGAGSRGASTLHRQLLERGVDSRFFAWECLTKGSEQITPLNSPKSLMRLTQKICFDGNLLDEQSSSFTLGYPSFGEFDFQTIKDADIIHLHDIRGLFSPWAVNLLIRSGKQVVWSLPDMWPFTGGCHYAMECKLYKKDCRNCPQLKHDTKGLPMFLRKTKGTSFNAPNLHVVSASKWLAESAAESLVFSKDSIHIIPPVVSSTLCPLPKREAKLQLGLAPDVFMLLVICEKTGHQPRHVEWVKQLLENCSLFNVFTRLARQKKLRILILGSASDEFQQNYGAIQVERVNDYNKLSIFLSAANLVVLPHFEENGSEIILEAAACGTPVIAMNTGGVNEFIQDGVTGKLVPVLDSRRMAEEISYIALHRNIQDKWEKNCSTTFVNAPKDAVEQHLELYGQLLKSRPTQAGAPTEIAPFEPRQEIGDLVPLILDVLNDNFDSAFEDTRTKVESAMSSSEDLKQTLQTSVDKLTSIESYMKGQLRHGTTNPKLEKGLISLGKHRNHLARVLRERKAKDESQNPRSYSYAPDALKPKYAKPEPTVQDRLLKWAYDIYLRKGHVARPGALRQYAPRPMLLEKFPKPRLASRKLPSIAIVTPSYMQGPFIGETLRSVIDQEYPKLRYAVQDAASTDETVDIIKKYSSGITTWVSEPDTGQARAVACGFEKVSGDIMAWLNSDDLFMPGALRFVGEYFKKHPNVDAIYGHRVILNENSQEIGRWVVPPYNPEVLRSVDYVPQETLFWRKSLWKKVGGISPKFRFALDWDLLLRFQEAGANIVRVPYFLGCFRVHTLQKTSAQMETIGNEEVNYLRSMTQRVHIDMMEPSAMSQKVIRQSALYEWLLRLGIRW